MSQKNTIAVVFDDHLLFADSFSALIERLELFNTVHTFNEERELTQFLIKNSKARIYLFIDYYLKNGNALPLINQAKRLNKNVVIIVISSVVSPIAIANILSYNPHGFVSKSSGLDTILECLDTIEHCARYVSPIIREIDLASSTIPFSARELEILQHFASGLSIAQTAERTFLSKHTVVSHRRKMMAKANVNSITDLLSYARKQELI